VAILSRDAAPVGAAPAATARRLRAALDAARHHWRDGAAALALLGLLVVERRGAGLDRGVLLVGLSTCLPVLVGVRAWLLPWRVLAVAAALPVSVLGVGVLAAGGTAGVGRGAGYAYGALLALAALGWATSSRRRTAAVVAVLLVVLDQFTQAWLPWWGSGDAGSLVVGTFYWHNQFGAFCLGGAALALGLGHLAQGRVRLLAVGVGAFAVLGVMLSGSRAALFALVAAWAVCLLLGVCAHGFRRAVSWTTAHAASTLAVGAFLVSPVFFPRWGLPWGPVGRRLGEGSLDGSTTDRWEFWVAGARLAADHPWTGPGLETFGEMSRPLLSPGVVLAADPHNELVRGFAEGGLVGGLPVLAVVLLASAMALRSLREVWRPGALSVDPGRWAALVAAGALVAHALVDFDWSYPALSAVAGICLGVAGAPLVGRARAQSRGRPPAAEKRSPAVGAVLISLAVLAAGTCAGLQLRADHALGTPGASDDRSALNALVPDHRLASSVLAAEVTAGRPSSPAAERAWPILAERASVDATSGVVLVELLGDAGRHDEALDVSAELVERAGDRAVPFMLRRAAALAAAGRVEDGAEQAARAVALQADQPWHSLRDRESAVAVAAELTAPLPAALACARTVEDQLRPADDELPGSAGTACAAFR
jgi:O-antigen ligase